MQVSVVLQHARHFFLLAILVLSGLDQAIVQTCAWTSMIYERSPELGLSEAVSDTFSGESPCEMCCALAEVTEEEQENAPLERRNDALPQLFATAYSVPLFPPARDAWPRGWAACFRLSIHLEIPTPPPELA